MSADGKCPVRGCGARVEATTNGFGRVSYACPGCDRVARGLCQDCPVRIVAREALDAHRTRATPKRRCAQCAQRRTRALARALSKRKYHDPGDPTRRRQLARQRTPERLAVRAARKKATYWADVAASRAERRAYYRANGEQMREYARNRGPRAPRAEALSEAARAQERQRKRDEYWFVRRIVGLPTPTCVVCQAAIPYGGRGMPRRYCDTHRPYRVKTGARATVTTETAPSTPHERAAA